MFTGEPFRRMHFFKGLFARADDWNAAQDYFLKKQRLMNQALFRPGIFPHLGEGLRVKALGGLKVQVLPGCAVDALGRDLFVPEPGISVPAIDPEEYRLEPGTPRLVYVGISPDEDRVEPREDETDPERKAYPAFIAEKPRVRLYKRKPDNKATLELGRIELHQGVHRVTDAVSEENPGPNEINMRFAPVATALASVGLENAGKVVEEGRHNVPAKSDPFSSDDRFRLGSAPAGEFRYYAVSAQPTDPKVRIGWGIETTVHEVDGGKREVTYWLHFENYTDKATHVKYRVFELRER